MDRRLERQILSLAELAVMLTLGCSSSRPEVDSPRSVRPMVLLTAQECTAAAVNGKVNICHRTSSETNPYNFIEVATSACINAHAKKHETDFISNDPNCARCGDGVVVTGETCDPPSSCPTSCDDGNACTQDTMTGSAATCNLACQHTPVTTCQSGDGCCAPGCNANNDGDCAPSCGNGAVEAGETCDPPSSCPSSCNDGNACTTDAMTGSAATCNLACQHTPIAVCQSGDGCCSLGCNANSDLDCSPSCGNDVVETGETCDPPSSCPSSCNDGNACTIDILAGSASSCSAACSHTAITACQSGDGCCAPGCNANTDGDCSPSCGNGVVETGETCDPSASCPSNCSDGNACTIDFLTGSAASCSAACGHTPISACQSGDGCCAPGCNANSDLDCSPSCGNDVVETGETCDPPASCPTSCNDGNACTIDHLTGCAANCSAACSHTAITQCQSGDGCCAPGCNANNDGDCSPSCGNGVVETGETCDPPSSCPSVCSDGNACTVDLLTGSASSCSAACSFSPISECSSGDGCCAPGCNANNDGDCSPSCGNGVVEVGETCDPPSSCPSVCNDGNACTVDLLTGSASGCSAACSFTPISECTSGDGCCAPGCNANNDSDCSPSCGNGVIEVGETCDPPSSCPSACDDGNACTVDQLTGSAANCSAACSHTPYTCVDALACTSDICNGDGTCTFAINPGNCVFEGVCHAGGHGPVDPEPNPPTSNEDVGMSVTGDSIGFDVSWDGRFTIGALHPEPWDLLYGWPGFPWTTGASIRVDGDSVHFGELFGDVEFLQYPYDAGSSSSVAVWRIGSTVITQTLRIVANTSTGEEDVVKMQYDLTNTDTEPHDVGLRMLLDTEINSVDGSPFRVPGVSYPITTETEFYGANIPQLYQAFSDLSDPVHVIEGTLKGGGVTPPDRFAMVSWNDAAYTDWDYEITPGGPFGTGYIDSGVLIYWYPETMQPGTSRRIVNAYGLGVLTGSPTLAISGPAKLKLVDNAWAPNPFTVMAYLKNTDVVSEPGEALTLSFAETDGLALDTGETATHALPTIASGETLSTSWRVVPLASGVWTYRVTKVSAPETWAQRSVTVPQPWTCVP